MSECTHDKLGFHSDEYYDGFACKWCGVVGEPENHDMDEPDLDEWDNEGGVPSLNGDKHEED